MNTCPLQSRAVNANRLLTPKEWEDALDCRKSCAWYDPREERCAIVVIAQNLLNAK